MAEKINIFKQDLSLIPSERPINENSRVALSQILEEIKQLSDSKSTSESRIGQLESFVKDKISKLEKINEYINILENQLQDFVINQQKINEQNFKSSNYIAEKLDDLIGLVAPFKEKIIEHEQKLIELTEKNSANGNQTDNSSENQILAELEQARENFLESIKSSLEASFEEKLKRIEEKSSQIEVTVSKDIQEALKFAPKFEPAIQEINNKLQRYQESNQEEINNLKLSLDQRIQELTSNFRNDDSQNRDSQTLNSTQEEPEPLKEAKLRIEELSQQIVSLNENFSSTSLQLEAAVDKLSKQQVDFQNKVDQEVKKILVPLGNVGSKFYDYDNLFEKHENSFKSLESQLEDFINAYNESSANNFKKFNEISSAVRAYVPDQMDKVINKQLVKVQEEIKNNHAEAEENIQKINSKLGKLTKIAKLSKQKIAGQIIELKTKNVLDQSKLPMLFLALVAVLTFVANFVFLYNNHKEAESLKSKVEQKIQGLKKLESLFIQSNSLENSNPNLPSSASNQALKAPKVSSKNKNKKINNEVSSSVPVSIEGSISVSSQSQKRDSKEEIFSKDSNPNSLKSINSVKEAKAFPNLTPASVSTKNLTPQNETSAAWLPSDKKKKQSYDEIFAKASRLYKNRVDENL